MHDLWQYKRNRVYTKDSTESCNTLENIKQILKKHRKNPKAPKYRSNPLATMLESVPRRPSLRNSENRDK